MKNIFASSGCLYMPTTKLFNSKVKISRLNLCPSHVIIWIIENLQYLVFLNVQNICQHQMINKVACYKYILTQKRHTSYPINYFAVHLIFPIELFYYSVITKIKSWTFISIRSGVADWLYTRTVHNYFKQQVRIFFVVHSFYQERKLLFVKSSLLFS